jgi:transposase
MPKLLFAGPPQDAGGAHQIRKLAGSRHAPGDWIGRARMIARSWDGQRTTTMARELRCHPQTVRERIARFNAEGLDGLDDRPGPGRQPHLMEAERSALVALARSTPRGRPITWPDGTPTPNDTRPHAAAHWTLGSLVSAACERGIGVDSQLTPSPARCGDR